MHVFNYIFYRVSGVYVKLGLERNDPDIYGNGIVALFQTLNIITILYFTFSIKMTNMLWLYIVISLFLINWFLFFNKRKLEELEAKWENEPINKRRLNGVLIIAYMIISIYFWILALSGE